MCSFVPLGPPAAELPTSGWTLPESSGGCQHVSVEAHSPAEPAHIPGARALSGGVSASWSQGGRPGEPAGAGTEQHLCPQSLRLAEPVEADLLPSGEPQALSASVYSSTPPPPPPTDSPPGSPSGLLTLSSATRPRPPGAAVTAAPSR